MRTTHPFNRSPILPTMTTAPAGILRSRPRYSSAAIGGARSDAARPEVAAMQIDDDRSTAETKTHATKDGKRKIRSLADLAQKSVDLSAEASDLAGSETGTVISHKVRSDTGKDDMNNFTEGETMSTLHISDEGMPYLQTSGGPPVVDADGVVAVGIMGEDGQQIKFCETGEEVSGNAAPLSSRNRLEQRLGSEYDDDLDVNDKEENICDLDRGSSGSDQDDEQDEEILRELGLEQLISDEATDIMDVEEWGVQANSEELRPFRIFWELLARWATPSTIELVLVYQGHKEQPEDISPASSEEEKSNSYSRARNAVDIGASRQAGIMSMLKMNIARCLSEFNHAGDTDIIEQRKVEQRLADLVKTFDSSAEAANLGMKMWKGLTTILIAISFPTLSTDLSADDVVLPRSISTLKMSAVEYRYLTQSAILGLGSAAEATTAG